MPYFWERDGILLRPAHPSDWVHFYENYFDSETRFYFYTEAEPPTDREEARIRFSRFLRTAKKKGRLDLTVISAEDSRVLGSMNLYDVDPRAGTFQIASFICASERGRGYAYTAMRILLDYAFYELRLNKYNARIVSGNEPSVRLHTSLGCKREGVLRSMLYHNGEYKDLEWWGMTALEYKEKTENARINEQTDK